MGSASLILLIICGVAFAGGGLLVSRLLAKVSNNPQKGQAYECGVPTRGTTWNQMNVGYYLFALLFLVFACTIPALQMYTRTSQRAEGFIDSPS